MPNSLDDISLVVKLSGFLLNKNMKIPIKVPPKMVIQIGNIRFTNQKKPSYLLLLYCFKKEKLRL